MRILAGITLMCSAIATLCLVFAGTRNDWWIGKDDTGVVQRKVGLLSACIRAPAATFNLTFPVNACNNWGGSKMCSLFIIDKIPGECVQCDHDRNAPGMLVHAYHMSCIISEFVLGQEECSKINTARAFLFAAVAIMALTFCFIINATRRDAAETSWFSILKSVASGQCLARLYVCKCMCCSTYGSIRMRSLHRV